jgi:hypothetical protein
LPAVANGMPAGPGRLGEQAGEAKHPPVDGDMVHLDTALSEQFLDVAVGQPKAQGPADRQDDDVGGKRKQAKADRAARAGRGRRDLMPSVLPLRRGPANATVPLWVIRCSQLPPQRSAWLLSTTSAESARERDSGDYLFHEPEAQPKCVTAGDPPEATLRSHHPCPGGWLGDTSHHPRPVQPLSAAASSRPGRWFVHRSVRSSVDLWTRP